MNNNVDPNFPKDQFPTWFVTRIINKLHSLYVGFVLPFNSIGKKVSLDFTCSLRNPHLIKLGSRVVVRQYTWLHSVLRTDVKGPTLIIDDGCVIGPQCQITAKNNIHMERDVIVGSSVLIEDHGHAFEDVTLPIKEQGVTPGGTIRIGQGSWIGRGSVVICSQGELVLGRNCVVGANAVVTRSVPAYSVVSGNPARIVKQFDPEKQAWVLGSVRPAEPELVK